MVRSLFSLIVCAAASLGCARINYDKTSLTAAVVHTERRQTPASVRATTRQRGTALDVQATQLCDVVEMNDVKLTRRSKPENAEQTSALITLGFAAAMLGTGIGFIVDAGHVHENDRTSRLYNSFGPAGARAAGITLTVLGTLSSIGPTAALVIGLTAPVKVETSLARDQTGRVIERGLPCADARAGKGADVSGEAGSERFPLGKTDARGELSVDLRQVLPPERLRAAGLPSQMSIWVGAQRVGDVDLLPVLAALGLPATDAAAGADAPAQVAVAPKDAAQVQEAARAARAACRKACAARCGKGEACAQSCVEEACK